VGGNVGPENVSLQCETARCVSFGLGVVAVVTVVAMVVVVVVAVGAVVAVVVVGVAPILQCSTRHTHIPPTRQRPDKPGPPTCIR
jgi:hypothetical protein